MDRRIQKDLLLKVEGLGKNIEYEDKNGNTVLFYEKNLDCNSACLTFFHFLDLD
jgi:hypothetical protein